MLSKKAAGKSPLFPPIGEEQMREKLEELTSRSPRALGFNRSRWTLEMLRTRLGEKAPETDSGTWHMLDRLGISHTQGQGYVLSPDEHFGAKRAFIDGVRMRTGTEGEPESETPQPSEAQSSEETENGPATDDATDDIKEDAEEDASTESPPTDRLFYLDELTYELHPTTGADWSPAGEQPTARRGTCGQKEGRLLGAMDAGSGRLFYRQKPSVGREKLIDLYREMSETYQGERLWVVQDNTPFHFHTDVLQALKTQIWPRAHPAFEYARPSQWPDPTEAALSGGELQVQVVPLPTYASWLNPIERLWRWLKQEVLHLHPFAGDWKKLKRGVRNFLERFAEDSEALLEYTGVSGD